jgi:hypothetical protein
MKRPRGFSILAVFLVFVGVGSIPAGIGALVAKPDSLVFPRAIGLIGLAYGILALLCATALWRQSAQAPRLFGLWSLSATTLLVSYQLGPLPMPLWFFLATFLPIAGLLGLGYRYVRRRSLAAV